MKHQWVSLTSTSPIPADAVVGGYDCDRSPIYVGRALHEGERLLAKVIHSKHKAYVCWEGSEIVKTEYEVLTGENYRWFECFVGEMPRIAIQYGCSDDGEPFYIGRGHLNGSLQIGSYKLSNQLLNIPFDGEERSVECCEILTCHQNPRWMPGSREIPKDAVVGGHEIKFLTPTNMYVGRAHNDGELLPAKILPKINGAYVSVDGKDVFTSDYEYLVGDGYKWVSSKHYKDLPLGAVSCGRTKDGELVYVGRGYHDGNLTPGKIYPTEYCVYIPYYGKEVRCTSYEVLVRNK